MKGYCEICKETVLDETEYMQNRGRCDPCRRKHPIEAMPCPWGGDCDVCDAPPHGCLLDMRAKPARDYWGSLLIQMIDIDYDEKGPYVEINIENDTRGGFYCFQLGEFIEFINDFFEDHGLLYEIKEKIRWIKK